MKCFNVVLIFIVLLISKSEMQAQATNEIVQPKYVCNEGKTPSSFYKYRAIEYLADGSKIIVSSFKDSIILGSKTLRTIAQNNFEWSKAYYCAKYNINNQLVWVVKLSESDTSFEFCTATSKNGMLAVTFDCKGETVLFDSIITVQHGGVDQILMLIDSNGNLYKHLRIGGDRNDGSGGPHNMAITSQNELILSITVNAGNSAVNTGYNIFLTPIDTLFADGQQCAIIRFNMELLPLQSAIYGGNSFDYGLQLCESNNFIYGIGVADGNGLKMYGGLDIQPPNNPILNRNWFLIKLDSNLNALWYNSFGSDEVMQNILPKAIACSKYGVGISMSSSAFGTVPNRYYCSGGGFFNSTISHDYFTVFYDTAGNFKNANVSKSIGDEYITDMVCDSFGNYYAVGKFDYTMRFPTDTLNSYGSADAMVTSYDPQGNFRWAASGGGFGSEIPYDVAINSQQKMVLVGVSSSIGGCFFGNDTLFIPTNVSNVFYASIDTATIIKKIPDAIDNNPVLNKVNVWPNPANNIIYTNMKGGNYAIFNSAGNIVKKGINQNTIGIDISSLASGLYTLQLNNKTQVVHQKICIQQ